MILGDTTRCTGLTRDASRICLQRRHCARWLAYQRDLRSAPMVQAIVRSMPDGFCSDMERVRAF